ncbi:MAG: hypothetical protein QOJ16_435 [Acidobacteriota bacterium]|jgi:plasmid stability protein|nr:hypothetical protein [Acidobacteriota bacterium]
MANQLTIRSVSEEVKERLKILSRSRGQSVNATLLEILEAAVGVEDPRRVQKAIAEKERLYRAYELMAAEEASRSPGGNPSR